MRLRRRIWRFKRLLLSHNKILAEWCEMAGSHGFDGFAVDLKKRPVYRIADRSEVVNETGHRTIFDCINLCKGPASAGTQSEPEGCLQPRRVSGRPDIAVMRFPAASA